LTANPTKIVQAQALTASRTPLPCGAIVVVTSTFTPTMTATATRTATATPTSCGVIYITATPGAPIATATFTPTPSCVNPTFTGHVYDAVTGLPISGATVVANINLPLSQTFSGTTDANGAYSFLDPYGCQTTGLSAVAAGYNPLAKSPNFANPNDFSLTKLSTTTPVITPTLTGTPKSSLPDLTVSSVTYVGSSPTCANNPKVQVVVANIGAFPASGSFLVLLNGNAAQTVNGLAAGQSVTLTFSASSAMAIVDSANSIVETNESNNSLTGTFGVPSQAPTCTPTGATLTPTRTSTAGPTSTRTRTATAGPTLTRTLTPTFTATTRTGTCSPVTSTITATFTYEGAGTFCWQSTNLGTYINSWNLTSLTINGNTYTNLYVAASSYPAKVNGYWYVGYTSTAAYGHFEAK
jgi:hypothetical protein